MAIKKKPMRKKLGKKLGVKSKPPAPTTSILDKIQPVTELKTNTVMMVYGRSGTGKTHFGSTFPKPILFIDTNERGTETIAQEEDVDVVRVTEWQEIDELYWALLNKETEVAYRSIVIDQVSNLQDIGMAEVLRKGRKGRDETFTQRNWGQLSGMLKQFISDFRDLSDHYNLLLIAHERINEAGGEDEEESIEPSIGARVMPSVSSFLDGAVDAIGSTFIKERWETEDKEEVRHVDYCMRIGPHAYYSTKIRRPVAAGPIPELIVNPTFQKIKDLTSGKSKPKRKVVKRKQHGN
ncbi:MAG TPA: AAA family ATPase [Dehalococcoidia bacterium]|jgi:phage nucleotide-binding protein|nr:AAA family ATPase [Dehalococcoidia bacterium]